MYPDLLSLVIFGFVTAMTPGPNNITSSYSGFNFGYKKTLPLILAVISEFVAPIFIVIGYKTKISTILPIATMFVATFIVHFDDPFKNKELAILYLVGFLIIFLMGPGKYSIDRK